MVTRRGGFNRFLQLWPRVCVSSLQPNGGSASDQCFVMPGHFRIDQCDLCACVCVCVYNIYLNICACTYHRGRHSCSNVPVCCHSHELCLLKNSLSVHLVHVSRIYIINIQKYNPATYRISVRLFMLHIKYIF